MKDKDSGLMEKQILSEENYGKENDLEFGQQIKQKNPLFMFFDPEKIYNFLNLLGSLIKSPRIFLILGLMIILIVSFLALVRISTNSDEIEQKSPQITITTNPTPEIDSEIENLKNQVENFDLNLEKIGRETYNLQFPEINLDIKF